MSGFVLRESAVKAIVLSFSIAGVSLLAVISLISDVDRVAISDLADHIGEEIECDGVVVGARHMDTGSASLQVLGDNCTIEVYIERSDRVLKPGYSIRIRGEPFKIGDKVRITVQSDRSVRILDRSDPLPLEMNSEPNHVYSVHGTMITSRSWGNDGFSGTIYLEGDGSGPFLIDIDGRETDVIPGSGDLINATGALMETGDLILFGDNVQVLSSPGVRAAYLLELIQDLESDPGNIPLGRVSFQCYPRYEPAGRSLYIGEEPDGSRLSVRVNTEYQIEGIHKGDLIEIVNGSFSWNPKSVRYEIEAPIISVIMPHGPWMINLASLEWGVSEYEGCSVRIEGSLNTDQDRYFLEDGGKTIEVRNLEEGSTISDGWLEGVVIFDSGTNSFYLDAAVL